jgi:hypothetical protein
MACHITLHRNKRSLMDDTEAENCKNRQPLLDTHGLGAKEGPYAQ